MRRPISCSRPISVYEATTDFLKQRITSANQFVSDRLSTYTYEERLHFNMLTIQRCRLLPEACLRYSCTGKAIWRCNAEWLDLYPRRVLEEMCLFVEKQVEAALIMDRSR